ncbi:MAG: restriction endonuclease subunit S [Bacteroidales bacterium]|nr:restriction endonuclease subunit S [Bacteroidales bacterium]
MTEWKEYKLGELIKTNVKSIGRDYPYSKILYLDTGSITCNNIDSFQEFELDKAPSRAKRLVKQDDIIYSSVRPNQLHYGYITNPQDNLVVSTGFVTITCNKDLLCPKFLYYFLIQSQITEYLHSVAEASTSAYPSLKPSDIEALDIEIPPLDTQRRIASILSSLDDKIDLLHRENATLEQMAETLFRQWFVEESKEEWEEGKLGDEFNFTMGQSPRGDSFNEEGVGIPMYQGNADFGFRFPTKRVFTTQPTRFAEPNDTLISVRAPVGAQNMATEKCCIGRGVAAFRYKGNSSYYSYTYYKLKSLLEEIKQFNDNGTVFGSISKSDFENLDIVVPDENTIMSFQQQVKDIDDKIINNNKEIQTLIQTRDGLLPRLMGGEIKI